MAENNDFKNTVETLFEGMEGFLQSKTVVGEAVHVGDTVVLPLVDVTFGVGAGANAGDKKYGNALQNWSMSRPRTVFPRSSIWFRTWSTSSQTKGTVQPQSPGNNNQKRLLQKCLHWSCLLC